MNKVVSIQVAGQVFWTDENAYEVLKAYLQKIRHQLADDECATEIYNDIELRIAELLFALTGDEKKAISASQCEEVVEQVGFIDDDDIESASARKSYLDPQNKILGGVCAGLAIRLGVPAFILRLVFIALTGALGLGFVLYLIFWISLEKKTSRNAALAAQGKIPTARSIASFETPKASRLAQLQRILFMPVSLVGSLLGVMANHFRNRRRGYSLIVKNVCALVILICSLFLCAGLLEFTFSRLFPMPITLLLGIATMYLIVLGLAVYFRRFYLQHPNFKIHKRLKQGALIPIAMIALASLYLNEVHAEFQSEVVEKNFALSSSQLNLKINDERPASIYSEPVNFRIETGPSQNAQISLSIDYESYGQNIQRASDHIRDINYFYTFENDTLTCNSFWTLPKGALRRGQAIHILIVVPQDATLRSPMALTVNRDDKTSYRLARGQKNQGGDYIAGGPYLHEYSAEFSQKLSENERHVLVDMFCSAFFISESWHCLFNIDTPVAENNRFDRAFQNDSQAIEQLREYLLPGRSLLVVNLVEINELAKGLRQVYPVMSPFQDYIERLVIIKSKLESDIRTNSG